MKRLTSTLCPFLAQLSAFLMDPTVDPGLTSFTDQLNATASNLMYAEDLPLIVDLFVQSLSVSTNLSMEAYMVREN